MKKKLLSLKVLSMLLASGVVLAACQTSETTTTTTPAPAPSETTAAPVDETTASESEVEETTAPEETTSEATTEAAPTGEQRTLKVDLFAGGNNDAAFTGLVDAFKVANPDVDVQVRIERELADVLNRENAMGEYSDVVYFNLGQPSAYTETQLNTGEVLDISDVFSNISDRMDSNFHDTAISNYFGDGKQYLLPIKYTPAGLFYNTELVGEGKEYELPETWEDMWALGEQVRADGRYLFTYPVRGYFDTTLQGLLDMAGGTEYLTKALQYGENTWDSDEGRQVLETIAKLVDPANEFLHPDTVANANAEGGFKLNQQAVIDGTALFMPNGDWIVEEMKDTTPEENFHWGIMPIPALEEGGDRVTVSFTEQAWIPKQANNVEDAKAFLEFIYSEEGTEIMVENGFVLPVNDVTDLLEDGYQKDFFSVYDQEGVRASIGAFAPYDTAALPNVDFKAELFGPIDDIATGNKTVDQWQTDLVELWDQIRANPVQ